MTTAYTSFMKPDGQQSCNQFPSRFDLHTGDTKGSELLDEIITNCCPKSWYYFLNHILSSSSNTNSLSNDYSFKTFDKFFKIFKSTLGSHPNHEKYRKNNLFYVKIWLLHIQSHINHYHTHYKHKESKLHKKIKLQTISRIYQSMFEYHIGINYSQFYIEWANYYISRKKYKKAKKKIKIGIKYKADPIKELNQYIIKINNNNNNNMLYSSNSDFSTISESEWTENTDSENDDDASLKHNNSSNTDNNNKNNDKNNNNMDVDIDDNNNDNDTDKKPMRFLFGTLPQRVIPNDDDDKNEDDEDGDDEEESDDFDTNDEDEDDEAFLNNFSNHYQLNKLPQITENNVLSPIKLHEMHQNKKKKGLSVRTPFAANIMNTENKNKSIITSKRRPSINSTNTNNLRAKLQHKPLVPLTPNTLMRDLVTNKSFTFCNRFKSNTNSSNNNNNNNNINNIHSNTGNEGNLTQKNKENQSPKLRTHININKNINNNNNNDNRSKQSKWYKQQMEQQHIDNKSESHSRRGSEPPTPPSWNNKLSKTKSPVGILINSRSHSHSQSPIHHKFANLRKTKSKSSTNTHSPSPTNDNNHHHPIHQPFYKRRKTSPEINKTNHMTQNNNTINQNMNKKQHTTSKSQQISQRKPSQPRLHQKTNNNHNNYRHHHSHQIHDQHGEQHKSRHNNNNNMNIKSGNKSYKSSMNVINMKGRNMIQLKRIGRGGSSEVFQVLTRDNHEILALKKIIVPHSNSLEPGQHHQQHQKTEAMENFYNEIELLRKLKNKPFCIQMIDYEIINDSLNNQTKIRMLFECGEIDLSHLLKQEKNGYFDGIESIKHYWRQMLLAVHTIHGFRIVHGDLKPANFLMVKGKLKLIDFGIAKQIISNDTNRIARDSQIGTLNYICPEALIASNGDGDCYKLGRSADVWSLGCILHQMCFGYTPFTHLKFAAKLQAIVSKSCMIHIKKHENEYVNMVIRNCLNREPNQRISVEQLFEHPLMNGNKVDMKALKYDTYCKNKS